MSKPTPNFCLNLSEDKIGKDTSLKDVIELRNLKINK